jgi:hypothetical protein
MYNVQCVKMCKKELKLAPLGINQYIFYVTDGNIMYLTDASRFLISCVIQHYAPVVGWRNRCIMLIMSLHPSWRQTLSLPPTGIEPGSPASQHIKFIGSRSKMTFMNCKGM